MDFLNFSLVGIISFLLISLAILVFYKGEKVRYRISFILLVIAVLGWIVTSVMEDAALAPSWRYLLLRGDFLFGAYFAITVFLFSFDSVFVSSRWKSIWKYSGAACAMSLVYVVFFTDLVISGYSIDSSDVIVPVYGLGADVFNAFIFLFVGVALGIIIWQYRRSNLDERSNYLYLFLGLFLSAIISLLTNVVLVDFIQGSADFKFYSQLGPYSTMLVALFPGYAIIRHRLFNVKILSVELLSFSILAILFFQIFISSDFVLLLIRLSIFLIALYLFSMLIRSIDIEIQRKEELQTMASQLALANEELRKLDNTKSEFISIASHQLRTPLTAIRGFLSLILEGSYGKVSSEMEDVVNKVYTANSHLVELVEDLLNVSRLESGRMQYQFVPAEIEKTIDELRDSFSVIAKGRGIDLSFVFPEKPIGAFLMDAAKIREVISNLIDNAMKYTKEGSVSVILEGDASLVRVIVQDTGIGIVADDLDKLFQKFRRGAGSSKVNVSGTGLGLYVGKRFAEAHGGQLYAQSDGPGRGSRFILELPFRTNESDPVLGK